MRDPASYDTDEIRNDVGIHDDDCLCCDTSSCCVHLPRALNEIDRLNAELAERYALVEVAKDWVALVSESTVEDDDIINFTQRLEKTLPNVKPTGPKRTKAWWKLVAIEWESKNNRLTAEVRRLRNYLEPTKDAEIERLRKGLRFYANGRHMAFADEVRFEWEDVSGEPPNWLQNNRSEHYEMIEDGTIAKMVLRGEDQDWSEHDDGEPPAIDGEASVSDRQEFMGMPVVVDPTMDDDEVKLVSAVNSHRSPFSKYRKETIRLAVDWLNEDIDGANENDPSVGIKPDHDLADLLTDIQAMLQEQLDAAATKQGCVECGRPLGLAFSTGPGGRVCSDRCLDAADARQQERK